MTELDNITITEQKKVYRVERLKEITNQVLPNIKYILNNKTRIIIVNFIGAVFIALFLLFFVQTYYESNVVILPEFGSKSTVLSQFSSIASLAGIKIGDSNPIQIYNNLLNSEEILKDVIFAKYKTEEFKDSVNLVQYFEVEPPEDEPLEIQQRATFLSIYDKLTLTLMSSEYATETGILTYTVKMPEAKLSSDVANKIAESLDKYIRTERKTYASEQKYYLEKRIVQVQDSLTIAEETLKQFRVSNRNVSQSPQLLLQQARLIRNTEILQAVYLELRKQFEIAKFDEIKDTPILNVREKAQQPLEKAGPRRALIFIVLMFFYFLATLTYYYSKPSLLNYLEVIKKSVKS